MLRYDASLSIFKVKLLLVLGRLFFFICFFRLGLERVQDDLVALVGLGV